MISNPIIMWSDAVAARGGPCFGTMLLPRIDHAAGEKPQTCRSSVDHAAAEPRTCRPSVDHAAAEPRTCRPSVDHAAAEPPTCRQRVLRRLRDSLGAKHWRVTFWSPE